MPRFFQSIPNKPPFLVLVSRLILGILLITLTALSLQRTLTAELTDKGRFIARHGAQMIVDPAAAGDLPAMDESGSVSRLSEYAVDITERKAEEEEREGLINGLTFALAEVKTLAGLLPVCVACEKIRDDKGRWQQMECFVTQHSEAGLSHGICPGCSERLYGKV